MVKIDDILKRLGNKIVVDAKENLRTRKKDKGSSGRLGNSFSSKVIDDKLIITSEDYAEFVDQGTKDSKGNRFLTDAVNNNLKDITKIIGEAIIDDIEQIIKEKT